MSTANEQIICTNQGQSIPSDLQNLPDILIKKISQLGLTLSIDPSELYLWLENYLSLETSTILSLIHLAITYRLDPLMGEVALWTDSEKQVHPSITIDGWMKIINCHPAFAGITFEEGSALGSGGANGMPLFMSCTIYRTDRQVPIKVREYFDEVKNDHPIWKSMPRRMLRHRVLQQCARLAFGISTPEWTSHEYEASNLPKPVSRSSKLNQGASGETSFPKKSTRTEQLKATLCVPIQATQFSPPLSS